jgi:hypothetical protein
MTSKRACVEGSGEYVTLIDPLTGGQIICANRSLVENPSWREALGLTKTVALDVRTELPYDEAPGPRKIPKMKQVFVGLARRMHAILERDNKVIVYCANARSRSPNTILSFFLLRGLKRDHAVKWLTVVFKRRRPSIAWDSKTYERFPDFNKFRTLTCALEKDVQGYRLYEKDFDMLDPAHPLLTNDGNQDQFTCTGEWDNENLKYCPTNQELSLVPWNEFKIPSGRQTRQRARDQQSSSRGGGGGGSRNSSSLPVATMVAAGGEGAAVGTKRKRPVQTSSAGSHTTSSSSSSKSKQKGAQKGSRKCGNNREDEDEAWEATVAEKHQVGDDEEDDEEEGDEVETRSSSLAAKEAAKHGAMSTHRVRVKLTDTIVGDGSDIDSDSDSDESCHDVQGSQKQQPETGIAAEIKTLPSSTAVNDLHNSLCQICGIGGELTCCDFCTLVYHVKCLPPNEVPDEPAKWECPACVLVQENNHVKNQVKHQTTTTPPSSSSSSSSSKPTLTKQTNFKGGQIQQLKTGIAAESQAQRAARAMAKKTEQEGEIVMAEDQISSVAEEVQQNPSLQQNSLSQPLLPQAPPRSLAPQYILAEKKRKEEEMEELKEAKRLQIQLKLQQKEKEERLQQLGARIFKKPRVSSLSSSSSSFSSIYKCSKCDFTCKYSGGLTGHINSHTGIMQTCEYCGYKSDVKSHFIRGNPHFHNCKEGNAAHQAQQKAKLTKCSKCDYSSKNGFGLTQHINSHTGIMQTCEYCGYKSDIKSHFKRGNPYFHNCKEGNVARASKSKCCPKCDFTSKTSGGLTTHINTHTGIMQTCEYCGFKSDIKSHFNRYSPNFHNCNKEGNAAHAASKCCPNCDFTSNNPGGLTQHINSHTGIMQTCEYCGYKSDIKSRFIRGSPCFHSCKEGNAAHAASKCCPNCDFTCAKGDRSGRRLTAHINSHSGIMKTCEYCGFKSDIKSHFNRCSPNHHDCNKEGNAAHAASTCCPKCDFISKTGSGLTQHINTHTQAEADVLWYAMDAWKVAMELARGNKLIGEIIAAKGTKNVSPKSKLNVKHLLEALRAVGENDTGKKTALVIRLDAYIIATYGDYESSSEEEDDDDDDGDDMEQEESEDEEDEEDDDMEEEEEEETQISCTHTGIMQTCEYCGFKSDIKIHFLRGHRYFHNCKEGNAAYAAQVAANKRVQEEKELLLMKQQRKIEREKEAQAAIREEERKMKEKEKPPERLERENSYLELQRQNSLQVPSNPRQEQQELQMQQQLGSFTILPNPSSSSSSVSSSVHVTTTSIQLGGIHFNDAKALYDWIQQLQNALDHKTVIQGAQLQVLLALIGCHPEPNQMIGVGIGRIYLYVGKHGDRYLIINCKDGSTVQFNSMQITKCIQNIFHNTTSLPLKEIEQTKLLEMNRLGQDVYESEEEEHPSMLLSSSLRNQLQPSLLPQNQNDTTVQTSSSSSSSSSINYRLQPSLLPQNQKNKNTTVQTFLSLSSSVPQINKTIDTSKKTEEKAKRTTFIVQCPNCNGNVTVPEVEVFQCGSCGHIVVELQVTILVKREFTDGAYETLGIAVSETLEILQFNGNTAEETLGYRSGFRVRDKILKIYNTNVLTKEQLSSCLLVSNECLLRVVILRKMSTKQKDTFTRTKLKREQHEALCRAEVKRGQAQEEAIASMVQVSIVCVDTSVDCVRRTWNTWNERMYIKQNERISNAIKYCEIGSFEGIAEETHGYRSGLRVNDQFLTINEKRVFTLEDISRFLFVEKNSSLKIVVLRKVEEPLSSSSSSSSSSYPSLSSLKVFLKTDETGNVPRLDKIARYVIV